MKIWLVLILVTGSFFFGIPGLAQNRPKTISFLVNTRDDPTNKALKSGAEEELAKLNSRERPLQIDWHEATDAPNEVALLQALAAKKPDAIAVRPINLAPVAAALNPAVAENVQVIIVDGNAEA